MPKRTMDEVLDSFGDLLDQLDRITRAGHSRYRAYDPKDLIELDSRAQASCTYAHMVAEADRQFLANNNVEVREIRGLKVWLFKKQNAVVRLKKMDEDGKSRNYPTKQAKKYDLGAELPGLPMPPIRLTAGYLLDKTGLIFERSQIAKPSGRSVTWCAAIVPTEERKGGEKAWVDVTREKAML